MPDPGTAAPPAAPTDQRDSRSVANNIVQGIHNKANGGRPAAPQTPPPAGEQKPPETPPDPNAGKEKYVVNGKEVWLTPEERTTWVQKGMAFEPRMDELARIKQETIQLQRALISDPGRVISNLAEQHKIPVKTLVQRVLAGNGSDEVKEAVGQWFYEEAVQPMNMTPEQLKAREDAKWRTEHEQKEKNRQEMAIRQENQAKVNRAFAELRTFIGEAMKESGLPNNNTTLGAEMARMVADAMRVARYNQQAITPKQAIEFVKKRMKSVQVAYYDHLSEDELVREIGEANAEKVQKFFLKKAQANGNPPPIVPKGPSIHGRNGERKTITPDDMRDYLDQRKKQG